MQSLLTVAGDGSCVAHDLQLDYLRLRGPPAGAVGRLRDFNAQELSNTVWAFATAGHAAPTLFEAVAAEARGRLHDFTPQELSNTAWAFAVTDARHPQFIAALTERLAQPGLALQPSELRQLQQFSLWCELELRLPEAQLLPPALRERCRDALRAVASGTAEMAAAPASRLQQSVGRALGRLGVSAAAEHALAEGYSVDFALVDERVAIEVDGPSHFALSGDGAGRRPVGKTVIKRRQLAALGWRLVSVTAADWDPLAAPRDGSSREAGGDSDEQGGLLRRALAEVGVDV